ncbi:hypothetical protein [Streptomyces cinerochromogenes]|uniref:hypothetical protein n=1 Tax=Streptomyces cinerochromogenes TaxID=66422 RepID=UPI0019C3742E|nr:hypothetical protein GCM10010206_61590 [Streptomyces cinerochromogenes]
MDSEALADRQVTGYGVGGLIPDVPAKCLPALIEWAPAEVQLGAEKLHGSCKDADALPVLTEAACERYGMPASLSASERLAGRRRLAKRGLAPWARIYRPIQGNGGGACSCASLPGAPWTAARGVMPRNWSRRSWPGCWACTRSGL